MPSEAMRHVIAGIIAVLVIVSFVVIGMMLPAKANAAVTFVDKWLADHGLDLALMPRVNSFIATPVYNKDTGFVDIFLVWTPTKKAETDLDRYVVSGTFKTIDGRTLTNEGGIPASWLGTGNCDDDIPDCGCSHIGSVKQSCKVPAQTLHYLNSGEYTFTLQLMEKNKKNPISTYQTDSLKFYTYTALNSLSEEYSLNTNMVCPYDMPIFGAHWPCRHNYHANVNLYKFAWIWNTAAIVFNKDGPECTQAMGLIKTAIESNGFTYDLASKTFYNDPATLPWCRIKANNDHLGENDYAGCHDVDVAQKEKAVTSINKIYDQMVLIMYLGEICEGASKYDAWQKTLVNYPSGVSEVQNELGNGWTQIDDGSQNPRDYASQEITTYCNKHGSCV
jgi:hypothetical protein